MDSFKSTIHMIFVIELVFRCQHGRGRWIRINIIQK